MEEESLYPFVNLKGDHLRDCGEVGYREVVRLVFTVSALVDEHCSPLEEPAVLLVPIVGDSPLHNSLQELIYTTFLMGGHFFNGKEKPESIHTPSKVLSSEESSKCVLL